MKHINLKAVIYGYLVFFIPSFILSFIGFEIGSGAFIFMIVGGYITARFAPEFEVINVISLAFFASIFSLLTVGIMYSATERNVEISTSIFDVVSLLFFSLSAPLLGGALRIFETKKRAT